MFDNQRMLTDAMAHQTKGLSGRWRGVLWLLTVIGIVAFFLGVNGPVPLRAWQTYLVNMVFFTGMAQGMVIFAATLQMTKAQWGRPVKRLAELAAYFLPLSLVFLLILYFGRTIVFPWIQHPIPEKQAWLNDSFLFARDFLGLLVLAALSYAFLKNSLKPDLAAIAKKNWGEDPPARQSALQGSGTIATILVLAFAVIYSLVAFDLIMSLDPHWYSTLFGAYYFITSFLTGMAGLVVVLVVARKHFGLHSYIGAKQFHDLGKLIFGFTIVAGDFFWSQFLVIWFGNLPEETQFVILRIREMPWAVLSYVVLFGAFVIPFVLLLSRGIKKKPAAMLTIATMLLLGMWLEKFLLVVPSIWHEDTLPLGVSEVLITLGFLSIFVLTYAFAISRHPILPVGDPLLQEDLKSQHS